MHAAKKVLLRDASLAVGQAAFKSHLTLFMPNRIIDIRAPFYIAEGGRLSPRDLNGKRIGRNRA
ncbi:hypothetical protein SAMN05414139_10479 [Burkholderia sp. D7]|nr:hypothetical protein SAMN05414139_10479 [Burkholderia sp. D7]